MKRVYLDNNIWSLIYERDIDLFSAFPKGLFELLIRKHGWFEIQQTPEGEESKRKYKSYTLSFVEDNIGVRHAFGYKDPDLPDSEQRVSGYDVGSYEPTLVTEERKRLVEKHGSKETRKEGMILKKQEADIELGAWSMVDYVITLDSKKGPLRTASEDGGKVIFLNEISEEVGLITLQEAASRILKE